MYYVYKFLDNCGDIIYIGRTKDLEQRMTTHFSNGHLPQNCYNSVSKVYYTEFDNYADMCMYEIYLINTLKPKFNTQYNKDNSVYVSEFKVPDKKWYRYNIGYSSVSDYNACRTFNKKLLESLSEANRINSVLNSLIYSLITSDEFLNVCNNAIKSSNYNDMYKDPFCMFAKDYYRCISGQGKNRKINEMFYSKEELDKWIKPTFFDYIERVNKCINVCNTYEDYISKREDYHSDTIR